MYANVRHCTNTLPNVGPFAGDASLLDEATTAYWAVGRIRENPAYAQLQDRVREIGELKARF